MGQLKEKMFNSKRFWTIENSNMTMTSSLQKEEPDVKIECVMG